MDQDEKAVGTYSYLTNQIEMDCYFSIEEKSKNNCIQKEAKPCQILWEEGAALCAAFELTSVFLLVFWQCKNQIPPEKASIS